MLGPNTSFQRLCWTGLWLLDEAKHRVGWIALGTGLLAGAFWLGTKF